MDPPTHGIGATIRIGREIFCHIFALFFQEMKGMSYFKVLHLQSFLENCRVKFSVHTTCASCHFAL